MIMSGYGDENPDDEGREAARCVIVNYLYSKKREEVPFVYQLLGSHWFSGFLGWVNYDFPLGQSIPGIRPS
jgi:hypothetical protein